MKKLFALLLTLSICLLCGCGNANEAPTTEAPTTQASTAAPTTEAPTTEAPTETVVETTEAPTVPETEAPTEEYTSPLSGKAVSNPNIRIFGVTIDNVPSALPHVNMNQADMVFEMYVNDHATRCLALYSDITAVEKIGAVRSLRMNFTDIALGYDAIIAHAGGSNMVIRDANKNGIDHFNVDVSDESYYALRDRERMSQGISRVHSLVAKGSGVYKYAENEEMRVTLDETKDFGMQFSENACPADGTDANTINITFKHGSAKKVSTLTYAPDLSEYIYTQYGKKADSVKAENLETFKNVFVVLAKVTDVDVYHVADILGSGEGYFACEGKMIPIQWHRENDNDTFTFTLADGTPLVQGIGSSYVAIAPLASTVSAE